MFRIILLDLRMPGMSGEEVLSVVSEKYPEIPVIIITAVNDVETAVRCMKAGAFDYIVKPVDQTRLMTTVKRALEFRELRRENVLLTESFLDKTLKHPEAFSEIITNNEKMLSIFKYIESIAVTSQPVLITGETGVGKELIARAIHRLSGCKGDLVAVNVAGLDDTTFSDTLFGHKRGAFTGADRVRAGLIEQAADRHTVSGRNWRFTLDFTSETASSFTRAQILSLGSRCSQTHQRSNYRSDQPGLTRVTRVRKVPDGPVLSTHVASYPRPSIT